MSKLKTHRGAAKRFRVKGNGQIKVRRANRNHILTKKTTKLKRQVRGALTLKKADAKLVTRMLADH